MNNNLREATVYVQGKAAATLTQDGTDYTLSYNADYSGPPISLTLPVIATPYHFKKFPAFFDGLLPEGPQLEALLKQAKLDRFDYFGQLIRVGQDLVGAVTVQENSPHD